MHPGNLKKEARKTDLWCSVLAGHNVPAHTSQVALTAATECGFEIFTHPSLSPDMAPSDFSSCTHLRGTQYGSNEGFIEAVNEYLGDPEKAFYFEGI